MGVPLTVSGRCTLYALLSTHWHTPNAALLAMLLLTLNQLKPAELPSDPDCPSQAKLVILTLSDLLSVQWQQLLGISPRSTIVYTTEALLFYFILNVQEEPTSPPRAWNQTDVKRSWLGNPSWPALGHCLGGSQDWFTWVGHLCCWYNVTVCLHFICGLNFLCISEKVGWLIL